MSYRTRVSGFRSFLSGPLTATREMVRDHRQRKRNLAELQNLDNFLLEDAGMFEYAREEMIRSL
ncbi:MAG: hypothetical protein AAGA53_13120 [Pseudomonadota bacterium]